VIVSVARFAALVCFCESLLYSVLTPLLPSLSDELHLGVTAAGLLVAAYPAGMVLGTVPAGFAAHSNARMTALFGLAAVAAASVGFALGQSGPVLVVARLVQGAGAAAAWSGALTWLLDTADPRTRGQMIGATLGASFTGTVVAPVLGLAAGAGARTAVFLATAALVAFVFWAAPPSTGGRDRHAVTPDADALLAMLRSMVNVIRSDAAEGLAWMVLSGVCLGLLLALSPLLLASHGVGDVALAILVLSAYAPQVALARRVGRIADRYSPRVPLMAAMLLLTVGIGLLGFVVQPVAEAGLTALMMSVALATITPSMTLVSERADRQGEQGMAMALVNGAWAVGFAVGAAGTTLLADTFGSPAAFLPVAGLCLTAFLILRARRVQVSPRSSECSP
jgi:MFS family permease